MLLLDLSKTRQKEMNQENKEINKGGNQEEKDKQLPSHQRMGSEIQA